MNATAAIPLFALSLGCAEPPRADCPRLQARVAEACESVLVTGVVERDFDFERDGYTLRGTLRLPVTNDVGYLPPGVVILHGSGPLGREGTVDGVLGISFAAPVHIYSSVAVALANRGFAVLTYDKRSCFAEVVDACVASLSDYPGDPAAIDVVDFREDARAAARALADQPDVADDILLVGHRGPCSSLGSRPRRTSSTAARCWRAACSRFRRRSRASTTTDGRAAASGSG